MNSIEQGRWSRIQDRLRKSVGQDAYENWLMSLKLVGMQDESAVLSVPTVFLQRRIQAKYAACTLSSFQTEAPGVPRIGISVRALPLVGFEPRAPKDARAPAEKPARDPVAAPAPAPPREEPYACTYPRLPKRAGVDDVVRAVARRYGVPVSVLKSSARTRDIVGPRQVGMYLARKITKKSFFEIGKHFGGRDHASVLNGVKRIERAVGEGRGAPPASLRCARVEFDPKLKEEVESLERELLNLPG